MFAADDSATDVLAPYASLKLAASGSIDQVIDPRTLHLQDGTTIRLLGVDIPEMDRDPPGSMAAQAFDFVTKSTQGKTYNFYQTHDHLVASDRFGHLLALAVDPKTGLSLQDELLKNGLARVWDGDATGFDLKWMMGMEDRARQVRSGLWQDDSPFRVFTPAQIPATAIGQLTLMTARVDSLIAIDNALLLALSDEGINGFILRIPPELRRQMSLQNIDPFSLNGALIRVRGKVEPIGRGRITLKHLWQLEILPTTLMPVVDSSAAIKTHRDDTP